MSEVERLTQQSVDQYVKWLLANPLAVAYVYQWDREREDQLRDALGPDRVIRRVKIDGEITQ